MMQIFKIKIKEEIINSSRATGSDSDSDCSRLDRNEATAIAT